MPASLRAHASRATSSSRPYDRSPAQVHLHLSRNAPPTSPIQATDPDGDGDIPPDHPGLPTYAEYKRIEAGYLQSLSPRKRDKALITQAMFDKIWDVLHQPEACTIETPQFRFWVRKMFTLSRPVRSIGDAGSWSWSEETGTYADAGGEVDLELERSMGIRVGDLDALDLSAVVLHENRPVAIMEQLYELFCYCHVRAGHGGRDKTCAVIREHYSWVPKELTAQFVKACPTCVSKRSGHGHVGVGGLGMDVGVVGHRRVVGRGGKRAVEAEETFVQVAPLGVGWPTTGGPLDPGNPEPCGVRERERERERLRARPVGLSSPARVRVTESPASGSSMHSASREAPFENCLPSGWNSVPRALTLNASPFHLYDTTRSSGPPFAIKTNDARRNDRDENALGSPTKTGLPSLTSALSNESLDGDVRLSALGPDAAECLLPPALRPLRLLAPASSETRPEDARSSYPFHIDPMLLSFDYPGLGLDESESEPGVAGDAVVPFGTTSMSEANGIASVPGFGRLRAPSSATMDMPALDPFRKLDSPDSSFEHTAGPYASADGAGMGDAALPLSLSAEFTGMVRNRCGSSQYGYRESPLAMFYHCSADEVGRELDGPLSFSIMSDA